MMYGYYTLCSRVPGAIQQYIYFLSLGSTRVRALFGAGYHVSYATAVCTPDLTLN